MRGKRSTLCLILPLTGRPAPPALSPRERGQIEKIESKSIILFFLVNHFKSNNVTFTLLTFSVLYRAFERVTVVLAGFAAILILAMSLWITYDVLSRYFFDAASPWAFDLSEYALVWITFLGAPWVLLQDRHVRIEILVEVLPLKLQRFLGILVCVTAIIICAILTWRTGIAAIEYFERNVMMPRIWRIPRIWPYCIIPIGSALLTIAFILRLGLYLQATDPEAELRAKASAGQETGLVEKPGK